MTPLIDVLLVLLIIFLIITPNDSHGLDTRIPAPATQNGSSHDIVVRIAADRGLTINTQPVSWEDLGNRFLEIYARRGDKVLFIDAARSLDFDDVAHVVDTAKGAGVSFVAFVPKDSAPSK